MSSEPPQPPPLPIAAPTHHIPPEGRDALGRIRKGYGGRPPGSKNRRSIDALNGVQDLAPDAVSKLAILVNQSNFAAIKYVLDATLPRSGRVIELDSSDPNAIIDAAAHGIISPDEAARLAQAYKTAGDAADLKELKQQVEELELLISALKK